MRSIFFLRNNEVQSLFEEAYNSSTYYLGDLFREHSWVPVAPVAQRYLVTL